jgi:hypothetical protein
MIVDDPNSDRMEPIDRRCGERPERVAVTRPRPVNELQHLALHPGRFDPFTGYGRASQMNVQ